MPIQRYTQREIIKQVSCLCKKPVVWHGENLPHTSTRERKEAGSILNVRAFHPPHVTFSLRDTVRCNCITEESGPPIFSSQIVGNHATMALWHSCFPCAVHHSLFPLCVLQCAWQRAIQTSKVFHSTITTKWEVKTVSGAEQRHRSGFCKLAPLLAWTGAVLSGCVALLASWLLCPLWCNGGEQRRGLDQAAVEGCLVPTCLTEVEDHRMLPPKFPGDF